MATRRKTKPKTFVVKRKRKLKRSLNPDEYVVYRDRKGRIRKPKSNILLFAEVRKRKTKEVVGYFNKFHKGVPVASHFVARQRGVIEARVSKKSKKSKKGLFRQDLSFTVYSSDMLANQIPREFYNGAMEAVRLLGPVETVMDIQRSNGEGYTSRGLIISSDRWNYDDFVNNIVRMILEGIDTMKIRFSPKKKARRKSKTRITRSLHIVPSFVPFI